MRRKSHSSVAMRNRHRSYSVVRFHLPRDALEMHEIAVDGAHTLYRIGRQMTAQNRSPKNKTVIHLKGKLNYGFAAKGRQEKSLEGCVELRFCLLTSPCTPFDTQRSVYSTPNR